MSKSRGAESFFQSLFVDELFWGDKCMHISFAGLMIRKFLGLDDMREYLGNAVTIFRKIVNLSFAIKNGLARSFGNN